jgi:hypothetical protein
VFRFRQLGRMAQQVWHFAMQNKAWWIIPTMVLLLLMALLITSGQAVAPFIYTLF